MIFKTYHIDFDKIVIDDQIINKPTYLSPNQWFSFWDFPSSVEYEEALDKAYQEGLEENEKEHEKELENLENQFFKQLERLENRIESIISNTEYSLSDRDYFIGKEFDEIKDIQWR